MNFKITKSLFQYNVYMTLSAHDSWLWVGSAWSLRGARKLCDAIHDADGDSDLRENVVEYIAY